MKLDTAEDVLVALLSNKHAGLEDLFYKVRDNEGKGWEGPSLVAWGEAMKRANELVGERVKAEAEAAKHLENYYGGA